jgi:thiol:disulfide interchange protein DsbD
VFGALSASLSFNLALASVMSLLALTMIGFGDLSALQNLGARLGATHAPRLNVLLMGMGAGLVASPCTGPILAAILTSIAGSPDAASRSAALLFVYSAGFALPYVFLGSLSAKLSQIKVKAGVQLGVKTLFAGVMFALAFYYLRIPLAPWLHAVRGSWWLVALLGISLGMLGAVLVFNSPRLETNKYALILPTLILGAGIFAGSQRLTGGDLVTTLTWYHSESEALAAARVTKRPILVDGWAEWCEACKKMDASTFTDSELIIALASEWTLLKLDLTDLTEENEQLAEKYGLKGLPTLVLLPPDGELAKKQTIAGFISSTGLLQELKRYSGTPR